ncbi:uncharacterized protein LOC62_01G001118 [Vanrija pseudolonga]|uniref:BRCT domain-containing protein n=1 Tax=Vanrija pseudolonga TaxID=143232 RepID=A0AAF0Y3U7_9TREE|nr:hypothetical protein LOC62_01G001118 [Vanrija pseudolonga]
MRLSRPGARPSPTPNALTAMVPDDETQQPLVSTSSSRPPLQPQQQQPTELRELLHRFAPSNPPTEPKSSPQVMVPPSSDSMLPESEESSGGIIWSPKAGISQFADAESVAHHLPPVTEYPSLEEDERDVKPTTTPTPDPQEATPHRSSSNVTDPSQGGELSQPEDVDGRMSEPVDDAEDVPTPPDSNPEAAVPATPKAARAFPTSSSLPGTSPFRPLTDHAIPNVRGTEERTLISPLRHATNITTPTKQFAAANVSTSRASSSRAARSPTKSPMKKRRSRSRSSSQESSDFGRGMDPKPKPRARLERLLSRNEGDGEPTQQSMTGDAHSLRIGGQTLRRTASLRQHMPSSDGLAGPGEATYINGESSTEVDSSVVDENAATSPPLNPFYSSSDRALPPNGQDPPSHTVRRYNDLDRSTALSQHAPSELFSDSMGSSFVNFEASSSQPNAFQATQIAIPQAVDPAPTPRQPPPQEPSASRDDTSSRSRSNSNAPTIPPHRMLQRRDRRSMTDLKPAGAVLAPRARRRSPSPPQEATYVEVATFTDPTQVSGPTSSNNQPKEELPSEPNHDEPQPPVERTPPPASVSEAPSSQPRPDTQPEARGTKSPPPAIPEEPSRDPTPEPARPSRSSPITYGKRTTPKSNGKARARPPPSSASDSSSSAPEDPEDGTFHDSENERLRRAVLPNRRPNPPKKPRANDTILQPSMARVVSDGAGPSRAGSRQPNRGKRKVLSPSPDLSGPSSGSAPEDEEDHSYRPLKKVKGKGAAKATEPVKKKTKPASVKTRAPSLTPVSPLSKASTRTSPRTTPRRAAPAPPAPRTAAADTPPVNAAPEAPLRVLGFWPTTGVYYAGTVVGRNTKGFRIKFDDGYHGSVPADLIRHLRLHKGEPVYDGAKANEVLYIADGFDGEGDKIQVKDARGKPRVIKTSRLVVQSNDISTGFGDRVVLESLLDERFPANALRSSTSLRSASRFEGMVFLLTGTDNSMPTEVLQRKIETQGGTVESRWEALFSISEDGYELATRSAPFVLQLGSKAIMTPKVMSALAAGVPLLAARYVDDTIADGSDWRCYLISPGESRFLGRPSSQLVDPQWGEAAWDASRARCLRQPLTGQSVLFVEPSSRYPRRDEIKVLIPFCLQALGGKVHRVATIPADLGPYDLVMVEDRDKGLTLSRAAQASGKLVNAAWLKHCLVLGKALPASLAEDK